MPITARADTRTAYQKAADTLDNAWSQHISSGFGDFSTAYDYREEGYRLGEEAADMPEEDRHDWIGDQTYAFPEHVAYLVGAAADFRLVELAREELAVAA